MIKRKVKQKRKNPYLVEYGYHFTNDYRLDSIMEKGLVPGFLNMDHYWEGCQKKLIEKLYKKSPIYFSDTPNIKKLSNSLINRFKEAGYNTCLKVNVSSLDQSPDLFMLTYDYGCFCETIDNQHYLITRMLQDYDVKEIEKYDYEIPFYALKKDGDQELQLELIFLTGTFVVNEKIDSKYIEEVIKVK